MSRSKSIPSPRAHSLSALLLAGGLAAMSAEAQITNHGCPKPQDSEFRMVNLVNRSNGDLMEPIKMDFDMDAEGNVDVYYVERKGRVRMYDAKTKTVKSLGRIAHTAPQVEHGLTGIALDPQFKQNRQIFIFYSTNMSQRVSRYTLNAAGELDLASEKVVITWPVQNGWHSGGAMQFDALGHLWITVGENNAPDAGAANTNDLRGKILRIKVRPDGTYEVPDGNLFPKGTEKTRPEIYVMGVRNPYSMDYDDKTGRLVWGCVGPDGTGRATEEHNMTSTPGNFGWPYFAGQNQVLRTGKDPAKPVNDGAGNTGLRELPPARGAVNSYGQSAAITGPVYRYTSVESKVKLPPHFDGVWFVTDYNGGRSVVDTVGVNAAGTAKTGQARVFTSIRFQKPLDFRQGPDGALYVINYGGPDFGYSTSTTIDRIEYTGTCRPTLAVGVRGAAGRMGPPITSRGLRITVEEADHRLTVRDLAGREVYAASSAAARVHDLAPVLRGRPGLHLVEVSSASGTRSLKVTAPLE